MLAINHLAWIDIPLVGGLSPRNLNYVAKLELLDVPVLGRYIGWHGVIAVRRGESDRDAVRLMRQAARDGGAVAVFVEGTRQRSGVPGVAQPGAAMVALQESVPVIPVAIYGTQFWKPWNFAPCSIALGEPVRFDGCGAGAPAGWGPGKGSTRGRDGRGARGRSGRAGRGLRHAVLAAREVRAVLDRGRGARVLRRPAEERGRLQGGDGRDRAPHPRALRLARRRARARAAAQRDPSAMNTDADGSRSGLLGTVAIVGFPNVGKSTLINRLTSSRAAVVHETRGTTRDRKELVCEWNGKQFLLIDTGGVDIAGKDAITRSIVEQARAAVEEADLVLFVVDARAGVTPGDEELAEILRHAHKPVLVLANKIDDPSQESLALEFHRLGLGDPFPLSGLHGTGTGDLLDEVVARLEEVGSARPEVGDEAIRVAILGRPNVGKSSLYNALLGSERTIVSEVPGTTRDAIDTVLERDGRTFVLVDTAGLRRKRKQRQGIEYYSELRALEAAERADVALVMIDSSMGIVEGDLAAADIARKAQCSTLVVLSKWDLSQVTIEDVRPELQRRLRQRPPFITISAKTGRGVSRVLEKVAELYDKHAGRIQTAELNRFLGELREARQPPSKGRRSLNLLYGAQVSSRPPRFRFTVNDPGLVTRDYGYWVENQLRERFDLEGVPVTIDFRPR